MMLKLLICKGRMRGGTCKITRGSGYNKKVKAIALWEIMLLVCMSFAIAFIISESVGMGSADGEGLIIGKSPTVIAEERLAAQAAEEAAVAKSAGIVPTQTAGGAIHSTFVPAGSTIEIVKANGVIETITAPAEGGPGISVVLGEGETVKSLTPATAKAPGGGGILESVFGMKPLGVSGPAGALLSGLIWAGVAAGVVYLAAKMFGAEKGMTNALTTSVFAGMFVGRTLFVLAKTSPSLFGSASTASTLATAAPFIGLGVAAAIFILTYKTEKKKTLTFQCLPWEAPIGGAKCEECNKDVFRPCSEYRCKALGQACQLLNVGTTKESCVWVNPKDVNSPTIKFAPPLTAGLKYVPDTSRPPGLGAKIRKDEGSCLQAFTPLMFSVQTNEPAQCKIDYLHTGSFDNMTYYFGESNYYEYNHTQYMRLPGLDTGENGTLAPVLQNDGTWSLYIRCRDANGNENVDEYSANICVLKGPDTTPPVIEGSSIISGSPVQYNVDQVPIEIYVNEPADCKWSRQDKAFADMENTMNCASKTYQINANLQYSCTGNLTGIENSKDNNFYFRCKDQPGKPEKDRNTNSQSYPLVLKGTQSLNIMKVEPNGTVYGSTTIIPVNLIAETANGAEEGKATCYLSDTGNEADYTLMFITGDYIHNQSVDLGDGTYRYYFRCIDAGGNSAEANTTFKVFADRTAPKVTRAYREGTDAMKIVTDEDAECAYSLTSCNFKTAEGIKMQHPSQEMMNMHISEWKPGTPYYVRCIDKWGNELPSNQCNIVVSATQFTLPGATPE